MATDEPETDLITATP
jgi:hypothetical protein